TEIIRFKNSYPHRYQALVYSVALNFIHFYYKIPGGTQWFYKCSIGNSGRRSEVGIYNSQYKNIYRSTCTCSWVSIVAAGITERNRTGKSAYRGKCKAPISVQY